MRSRPSAQAPWLGFLSLGGSVALPPTPAVPGDGCDAFAAIEPRGYVCLDEKVSLDARDPAVVAVQELAPQLDNPWPHDYAESRQTPRYYTLPTYAQQQQREFRLAEHLETVAALRSGDFQGEVPALLRDVDVARAWRPLPAFLDALPIVHEYRDTLKAGSTLSFRTAFDYGGRTWLVTGDGALVPKDRVAPYARSTFQGVALGEGMQLPLGFVVERERPQYVRKPDGALVLRGAMWPRLAQVGFTGAQVDQDGRTYLETSQSGFWIAEEDVTVVRAAPVTPWGDAVQAEAVWPSRRWSARGATPPRGGRETWVEVSVHGNWMIAYEGTRPVYATLVATGRGQALAGTDFEQTSTPPGVFKLQSKLWTSTMAVNSTAHYDVPFAMPYDGAYALHAAYWHDRWGEKVSLGCVNLSPTDARWLFLWAEPSMPAGWHAMRFDGSTGYTTVVVIHA